jgi:hypothetical protein
VFKVSAPLITQEANRGKGNGNGKPDPSLGMAIVVSWWEQASPEARVEFVESCGIPEVWDAVAAAIA